MTKLTRWMTFFSVVTAFGACGGSASEDAAASTSTAGGESDELSDDWGDDDWGDEDDVPQVVSHAGAAESLGLTPPDTPWAEMSMDEREYYMIGKVLPIMKEVFTEHDSERWPAAEYECATCHGEDGPEREYAMPAGNQYRVPEEGTPAYENMRRIFPEMVQFMEEEVTPTMGTILGIENYTCHHCHPAAG